MASSSGCEEFHCTMASPAHGVDAGPLTPPLHPRRGAGRQERRGESVPSLRVVTKKGSGWGGSCVTGGIAAAKIFAVLGGPRERRRGSMSLRRGERPTYVRPRHRLSPLTLMPVTAESVTVAAPARGDLRRESATVRLAMRLTSLHVLTTAAALGRLAVDAADAEALPCEPMCQASCCGFDHPAHECAGCDPALWKCAPTNECYERGSKGRGRAREQVAGGKLADGSESGCFARCNSSCCYFSDPGRDCGECDPDAYQCAPGKLCFEAGLSGNVSAAWAPETTAKGVCREFCRDTPHCCWFADAKTDCAACPPDHGCNPTASCFAEGPRVEL